MELGDRIAAVVEVADKNAASVDAEGRFPEEAVAALRSSGLLGLTLPSQAGGLGLGPVDLVGVVSRLAAACGSTAMVYLMHVAAAMPLAAAPPNGRSGLLARLASGELLATLAFSEPGSRSHFWAPISQASRSGGSVTLAADKSWVTSAGHADIYVVSTLSADRTDGAIDLYAVDGRISGITVTGRFRGLGLRGNASAPMRFEASVADGDRLGEPGAGFELMTGVVMPWFNLGNAAVSVGLAGAATTTAVQHAATARLHHADQALAELPTIRAQLSRMSLKHAAAQAYLNEAAAAIGTAEESAPLHVLGVKALANDTALEVTDAAMRVCGGTAFSAHLPLERIFRDARAGHVMAPTADVLYDFYGKAVTGLPVFG
jgi:alkylation response protein AidB-like acyl-CoA dehydrogenase